jgi:AcrR family transcriptional regulator
METSSMTSPKITSNDTGRQPAAVGIRSRPEGGTRKALLAAAVDELAEHGYAGVSLRAVARRAGLSHAAPQHFFGSRAGLLTAVAAAGFHDLTAALTTAAAPSPASGWPTWGRSTSISD